MRRLTTLLVLAVLSLAAVAQARVESNPIRARMERPERLPEAGREFSAVIRIEAAARADLRDLVLDGDGWTITRFTAPRDLAVYANDQLRYEITATPGSGFGPLVLTAEVDGRRWRQSFDLSREAYGGLLPSDSDRLPSQRILPAGGDRMAAHRDYTLAELEAMAKAPDDPVSIQAPDKDRSNCTINGNVVYWHGQDNHWAHAAEVFVVAFGEGFPFGPMYDITTTDEVGVFSLTVPQGLNVRLQIRASSTAAIVQRTDVWENNYQWWTTFHEIPQGASTYDIGPIYPNNYHGAMHICTVVTHSRNHFRDVGIEAGYHWNVQQVDVQWPEEEGSSYYNPYFEELHIRDTSTWTDWVIAHEWGHYWHHQHAYMPGFTYCNGVCDDDPPDDCGHCEWCPEYEEVAWIEGLAQLISRLCTAYMEPRVVFDVRHVGVEFPRDDPDCAWIPWRIENVVAGAIWDIANDSRGTDTYGLNTDVLGNPLYDQLALGTAEILRAITVHCDGAGHRPHHMPDYFHCLAGRLANLGDPNATVAMLWETAMNWDLQIDEQPPAQVPNLTSTLPVNTPSPQAVGGFYWNAPEDDVSGTAGYSVALVQGTGPVMPDHVIDTVMPQIWTGELGGHLAPGTYYFSVIAVDRAGNWGTVPATYGPIIVTEPYPVDLQPYTPTGWTAPLVLRSTTVSGSDPVTQPDVVQGHTVYLNLGYRNTAGGNSGPFRNVFYIDGSEVLVSNQVSLNGGVLGEQRNLGPLNLDLIGRHTVWARVDGQDNVAELNEDNNIAVRQFVFRPKTLAHGETVVRSGGLPHPEAGFDLLPEYMTPYPTGDGFDIALTAGPELIWAVPDRWTDLLLLRLHARDIGQSGFAEVLAQSQGVYSDQPAMILNNPWRSNLYSFCVGVTDASIMKDGNNTYRIHRELGRAFSMPDTLGGELNASDCLDFYFTQNGTGQAAWFTVKLANAGSRPLYLHVFDPELATGTLTDAIATIGAAPGGTAHHSFQLAPSQTAYTVVTREVNLSGTSPYTISAYVAKPDLAATTPTGWFANLVPHVGRPYNATQDGIPAPSRLAGFADSTGIYWSLRNISESAGVPIGLQNRVELDGAFLFGGVFAEPIAPGQEVRGVRNTLYHVRGGRHTLAHRINANLAIDEDNLANNRHGRQWVWEPALLSMSESHTLPIPPSAYGGLNHVTEGLVALNCDGYRLSTTVPGTHNAVISTYMLAEDADVDVGYYSNADVQDGYVEPLVQSTWSGDGCDFVLRTATGPGTYTSHVGLTRSAGAPVGEVTLRAERFTTVWHDPVGAARSGAIEAGDVLDCQQLVLPPGQYRFTMQSDDAPLGFSLHDLSDGFGAKSSPWQDGIAWQSPGTIGDNVDFVITIPDPAPALLGMAVWRPDATGLEDDAYWMVTVQTDATGVEDDGPDLPAAVSSRLLSAAPNPFNPMTMIHFEVARAGRCELVVHDLRGRVVRTLVAGDLSVGRHEARWDGHDTAGRRVPSGTYMVRLRTTEGDMGMLKLALVK